MTLSLFNLPCLHFSAVQHHEAKQFWGQTVYNEKLQVQVTWIEARPLSWHCWPIHAFDEPCNFFFYSRGYFLKFIVKKHAIGAGRKEGGWVALKASRFVLFLYHCSSLTTTVVILAFLHAPHVRVNCFLTPVPMLSCS